MKIGFKLKNVSAEGVSIGDAAFDVEYNVEEFTALVATYPEFIKLLSDVVKAMMK